MTPFHLPPWLVWLCCCCCCFLGSGVILYLGMRVWFAVLDEMLKMWKLYRHFQRYVFHAEWKRMRERGDA